MPSHLFSEKKHLKILKKFIQDQLKPTKIEDVIPTDKYQYDEDGYLHFIIVLPPEGKRPEVEKRIYLGLRIQDKFQKEDFNLTPIFQFGTAKELKNLGYGNDLKRAGHAA